MTRTQEKQLDKLDSAIQNALDTLYEGREATTCDAFEAGAEEGETKFPTKAVKACAKKLTKALALCDRLLDT